MRCRVPFILATAGALALPLALPAVAADAPPEPVVVAIGLDNPRQLSLTPGGSLYIAEAGNGRGKTSRISVVRQAPTRTTPGKASTVAGGFFSLGDPDTGSFAVGVDGVSVLGKQVYGVTTSAAECELEGAPFEDQAGLLVRIDRKRGPVTAADISAYEYANNPDGGTFIADDEFPDCQQGDAEPGTVVQDRNSNPYAVLALLGRTLIADAGGNVVYEKRPNKALRVFAVLPERGGRQTVPTSLAAGLDGSIYVGELYEGEDPGGARVRRYSPSGQEMGFIDGFAPITGVAVDREGSVYVSELFGFQVTRARFDSEERSSVFVPAPAGLAVTRDGDVLASVWSIGDRDGGTLPPEEPGGEPFEIGPGQVWRIPAAAFDS